MDVQVQLDFDSKGCFFFFLFTMILCESCKPRGVQQFHLALMAANSWTGEQNVRIASVPWKISW